MKYKSSGRKLDFPTWLRASHSGENKETDWGSSQLPVTKKIPPQPIPALEFILGGIAVAQVVSFLPTLI